MNEKEKARSTAATVKRAEAAAFSGAAASFSEKHNTASRPRQAVRVADVLPAGAGQAVRGQTLAALLGFRDVRQLSKQIECERRGGVPICAAVSGDSRGYYLASSPDELQRYIRALDHRLREVRRTRDACEDTLRRMCGQEIMEGME